MKRVSETKIIPILKEAERDITVRDVCRKHQITKQTFYRRRNKYGSLDACEARHVKELERENTTLKQIVADLTLDHRKCQVKAPC